MPTIRNLISGTSIPNWLVFVSFFLSVLVNFGISQYQSDSARLAAAKIAALHSFETEASKFNVLFSSFAYGVMETGKIDDFAKNKVLMNLNHQHSLTTSFSTFSNPSENHTFKRYGSRLFGAMKAMRAANNFSSLGDAYQSVAFLLDEQEELLKVMRRIAGTNS